MLLKDNYNQGGFTLVELAVVMIIIGLLIGGVLKGQELISNAQVTSTVAQVKGIDAAIATFQDSYNAFPGDMSTAEVRLPNCGTSPCVNGSGNSRVDRAPNINAQNAESLGFWAHLNVADLFSGVNGTANVVFGEAVPAADIGGGFVVGFSDDGDIFQKVSAANARAGHYLVLRSDPSVGARETVSLLSTTQAFRIDNKMDDGAPNAGTVRAIGSAGAAANNCADADTAVAVYNEALDGISCSLAIRIR